MRPISLASSSSSTPPVYEKRSMLGVNEFIVPIANPNYSIAAGTWPPNRNVGLMREQRPRKRFAFSQKKNHLIFSLGLFSKIRSELEVSKKALIYLPSQIKRERPRRQERGSCSHCMCCRWWCANGIAGVVKGPSPKTLCSAKHFNWMCN